MQKVKDFTQCCSTFPCDCTPWLVGTRVCMRVLVLCMCHDRKWHLNTGTVALSSRFPGIFHLLNPTLRFAISTCPPPTSCLSLKPCGTRPVYPSQEAWGRMAASWRQTAPKPCMLATPPSDTPALQWSPPDCPENQKHLLCLNHAPTHRQTRTNRRHAHTLSHA